MTDHQMLFHNSAIPSKQSYAKFTNIWRIHAVLIGYSSIILVARLWKKARIHLKVIHASRSTLSPSHKIAIASYFTSTYRVSLTLIFWFTTK
ncbi:uncharacterized protein HD556DRAFT_1423466 [Suillus plorans]|uniref:Uncharacterized protein n=1 Tax=Suillus plorans TaxID=116603 RepID=A0A9P7D9K8_9AGAM|nr:uncharacterized protein HD556DRAFT_1423466 [Suillus plorans]KAG1785265.1 hypothetical protein HD556DRAFT_1423466 [Suillus plorans]